MTLIKISRLVKMDEPTERNAKIKKYKIHRVFVPNLATPLLSSGFGALLETEHEFTVQHCDGGFITSVSTLAHFYRD